MSGMNFLDYAEAVKLVAAIQEEEDLDQPDRRVLTVYNHDDQEICWFDFEEVMAEVAGVPAGERKEAVQNYILHRIPDWAKEY